MGNNLEVNYQRTPYQKCSSNQTNSIVKHATKIQSPTFRHPFTHQNTQPIRLSSLRFSLSAAESFYVLSALIQQYYSLFKFYRKVVVSDHLCVVNQFGEVKVDFCIDGPETSLLEYDQVIHCFVTVISQVMTTVERLAAPQELEGKESVKFRKELVERVQRCHSEEEKTYHAVMEHMTSFLQGNQIRCNLLTSFLRYWNESRSESRNTVMMQQEQTPFLANSQVQHSIKHSFSTSNLHLQHEYYAEPECPKKYNEDTQTRQSNIDFRRTSSKGHSRYRHKIVKTEGENYYTCMSKRNQCPQPSTFYGEDTSNTRFEKTAFNRISHQYTLNILNKAPEERHIGGLMKGKHNKSTISLKSGSQVEHYNHNPNHNRRETSLHDFTEVKCEPSLGSLGKSYAKSMLEQLARSVSIRDEPNSRDHIN